jgi:hypothetical protein
LHLIISLQIKIETLIQFNFNQILIQFELQCNVIQYFHSIGEMVFLHPSSFIHSLALSASLSSLFLPVLLRLHLGCGEAIGGSNGSDGDALAWCSRAYFS